MFHPYFVQPQQIFETWNKGLKQQFERLESMNAELDKAQSQGLERAGQAVDETAKLVQSSLTYAGQLSTEWRKWWLGAAKQTFDWANPAA